jgi:hypothetical protein
MRSFDKRSSSARHPNAFTRLFLDRLGRRDEPPTAGTGRDPMLLLQKDEDAEGGYPLTLETGELVGLTQYFDEKLVDGMNVAVFLLMAWTRAGILGAECFYDQGPADRAADPGVECDRDQRAS